jgi:hypothetical protein
MSKQIVIPKGVVIPRQLKTFEFQYRSWETEFFLRMYDHFDLNKLGIEMYPRSDRFYCYDPEFHHLTGPFRKDDLRYLCGGEFRFATKTTFVIRKDITIDQFFGALRPSENLLLLPDDEMEYYVYLSKLFHVKPEEFLLEELKEVLANPPNAQPTILPVLMLEEETGKQLEFEFMITQLFGWTFARLLSVKYQGSVFEHYVRIPNGTNIYSPESDNVVSLKDDFVAFSTDTPFETARQVIYKLMYIEYDAWTSYPAERVFINQDMALVVRLWDYMLSEEQKLRVQFHRLKPDYTMFLE